MLESYLRILATVMEIDFVVEKVLGPLSDLVWGGPLAYCIRRVQPESIVGTVYLLLVEKDVMFCRFAKLPSQGCKAIRRL